MSAIRKIVVSVAALLISASAMFVAAGTASADCPWDSPTPCAAVN